MRRFAILGAFALLAVCGCKKGPNFVGAWTTEVPSLGTQSVTLNADKSATASSKLTVGQMNVNITAKGTWSNTDKDFTITMNDIKLEGLPPQLEAMAKTQIDAQKGKPQTGAYTWNGEDEFSLTVNGKTQKFTRVKS